MGEFAEYIPDAIQKMVELGESFGQEERVVQL